MGRGLCTAIVAPSPALHYTCGRRTRGSHRNLCTPELYLLSKEQTTHVHDGQNQIVLLNAAMRPCQVIQSLVHGKQERKPKVALHSA